ncbi:MAG: STAS/SEC14 domain-containing protein [Pseudobdellovibrionaceae bacterium]
MALQKIENLPTNVVGVRAEGEVTQADYEKVLIPMMENAYQRGQRVRFLFQFSPDYSKFSAGAAWSDFKVGLKYLRLFERCAVVSKMANVIDPWIEAHQRLNGLVVAVPKFPGWENFGSFIRHMEFVKGHHRKIRKVALVADGVLPELAHNIAKHFVEAEIKQFPFSEVGAAEQWAGT